MEQHKGLGLCTQREEDCGILGGVALGRQCFDQGDIGGLGF